MGTAILLVVGLAGLITIAIRLRDGTVKRRVTDALSEHLKSEVTINTLSVHLFPTVSIVGEGLVIRRWTDPPDRPIITASRFIVRPGLWHILKGRAELVEMEGMRMTIPKRPANRPRLTDTPDPEDKARAQAAAPAAPEVAAGPRRRGRTPAGTQAILERLIAFNAELVYISSRPDGPTRVFRVPELELKEVSFDDPMDFRAVIANPLFIGRLEASGLFGPFASGDPGSSPVEGGYVFTEGDFNTVKGLAGSMTSRGLFSGQLDQMHIDGTSDTPDFQIDAGGHALPLHTEFRAIMDGTDGDVVFSHLEARLAESAFTAKGSVIGIPGVKGRRVALEVEVPAGRLEDFLNLAMPGPHPPLTGDVTVVTSFVFVPGDQPALSRMELNGRIGLTDANFSNRATQAKVRELSRRAQGKPKDAPPDRAVMGLTGRFVYKGGVARFTSLKFRTTGALVSVAGTFTPASNVLDFSGTIRMDAKVSKVVGGVKGFFLKLADPLFRAKGAGSEVPITIKGTADAPKASVDKSRIFGG